MRARASRLKRSLPLGHSARIEVSLRCVARLPVQHTPPHDMSCRNAPLVSLHNPGAGLDAKAQL